MAFSRKYSLDGEQNIASPDDSMLTLTATAAVNPSIFYFTIGFEGTPADNQLPWYIQRFTAAGTGTAVTPQNLGPDTTAATAVGAENHTIEPTYSANAVLWRLGLNQRAAYSVVLDPEGCLTAPATANNGLGLYGVHGTVTALFGGTLHFRE